MPITAPATEEIVIEAGRAERNYWRDLWRYRELFFVLAWRDVAVRYKQTVAGAGWAIVQPLLSIIVMTVIFGRVAGLPSDGNAPYAVMVFAGMLPWQFFVSALSAASHSIAGNASLISKVYFPRLIVPASTAVVSLIDFLVASLIMASMMVWYRFWPGWTLFTLPVFMLVAIVAAIGPGLIMTALIVRYRDFRYAIPFVLHLGLYVSPVAYSTTVVRDRLGETAFMFYSLNPMVFVIDGFRWAILGTPTNSSWPALVTSLIVTFGLFAFGLHYFRKTERVFADIV